jgi:hypothetical protein
VKNPAEAQVEKFFQPSQVPLLEQNQQSKTLVYCYSIKKTALENCADAEKMQEFFLYLQQFLINPLDNVICSIPRLLFRGFSFKLF